MSSGPGEPSLGRPKDLAFPDSSRGKDLVIKITLGTPSHDVYTPRVVSSYESQSMMSLSLARDRASFQSQLLLNLVTWGKSLFLFESQFSHL